MKILFYGDVHLRGGAMHGIIAQALCDAYAIGAERGVDAAVCTGDLFDSPQLSMGREASAGDIITSITRPAVAAPFPTYMLPGNHDQPGAHRLSALSAIADVPGIHVYEQPALVPIHHGGETAHLALLPWVWKSHLLARPEYRGLSASEFDAAAGALRRNLLTGFAAQWAGERGHKILAMHAEIDGSRTRYMELPEGEVFRFSMGDLREAQADSIAAGHVHLRQDLDGVPCYIGALVQQNFGEAGNPCGVMILDTESGAREYVEIDSRRHYTCDLAGYAELIATGRFREGQDAVKVRDAQAPAELVAGAIYEKAVERRESTVRAEGATHDSSVQDLLPIWYGQEPRAVALEALSEALTTAVAASPIPVSDAALGGCIDAIREIRIQNFATHVDTHIRIPETMDGLIALYGRNGSGKTTTVESVCAALWGKFCFYDAPSSTIYDMILRPGDALLEVVLDSRGRTYRARRAFRMASAKTKSQEADLFEVVDGRDVPVAGGKSRLDEYNAAVERLFGTRALFLATVFQAQKDVGSLIDADPADRMEFMRRRVGADRYDGILIWTRAEAARHLDAAEQASRKAAALVPEEGAEEALRGQVRDQETAIRAAADAIEARRQTKAVAEEEVARLRADQLAREEIVRQVEGLGRQAHDLANTVQITLAGVEIDEQALDTEPALRSDLGRLQALREELGHAERHAERVRTAEAERSAVQARIDGVEREVDAAYVRAMADASGRRATLREQAQDLGARIEAAVVAERAAVAERRGTLGNRRTELRGAIQTAMAVVQSAMERERDTERSAIQRLRAEIYATRRALEKDVASERARCVDLEAKVSRLAAVGCRDNPLPCPLIDDAREAPRLLAVARGMLESNERALETGDFCTEARRAQADAEARLQSIGELDESSVAPEQRAELAQVEADLQAITDVDPMGIATDLREQRAEIIGRGKAIVDPMRDIIAMDFADRLRALREQLAAIEVPSAGRTVADVRADIGRLGDVEQRLGRLAAVRDALPGRRAALEAQQIDLDALRQRHAAEQARLEAVANVDRQIAEARARALEADRQISDLQNEQHLLAKRLGVLEAELEALARNAAEALRLTESAAASRERALIFGVLADFFAPAGVPQLLIDLACPQINDIMAEILAQMDEATVIEFSTQRDLKGGGTREGLWINITDVNGTRDIAFHSGGEQSWLRQIVRQGLGLFSVQREGASHQVFICDEPTAHVDTDRVPKLLGIVYALAKRFRQVWVIDHHPYLLNSIGNRFHFEAVNGRTTVSGIGDMMADAPTSENAIEQLALEVAAAT